LKTLEKKRKKEELLQMEEKMQKRVIEKGTDSQNLYEHYVEYECVNETRNHQNILKNTQPWLRIQGFDRSTELEDPSYEKQKRLNCDVNRKANTRAVIVRNNIAFQLDEIHQASSDTEFYVRYIIHKNGRQYIELDGELNTTVIKLHQKDCQDVICNKNGVVLQWNRRTQCTN